MNELGWQIVDWLLVVGVTLRLTRLLIKDHLGRWYVQEPADAWAGPMPEKEVAPGQFEDDPTWRHKITEGLGCPHCIGFWLGIAVVCSLYLSGGPGEAAFVWRIVAAVLTLNVVVGHTSARLDS